MKDRLVDQMLIKQYYCSDVYSSWVNLAYDISKIRDLWNIYLILKEK